MRNRIVHHPMLDSAFIHKAHVDNDIAALPRHKVAAMEQVSTQLLRFQRQCRHALSLTVCWVATPRDKNSLTQTGVY